MCRARGLPWRRSAAALVLSLAHHYTICCFLRVRSRRPGYLAHIYRPPPPHVSVSLSRGGGAALSYVTDRHRQRAEKSVANHGAVTDLAFCYFSFAWQTQLSRGEKGRSGFGFNHLFRIKLYTFLKGSKVKDECYVCTYEYKITVV